MKENQFEKQQRENLELVRDLYEAFARSNIAGLLELLDEDVNWSFQGPGEIPFAGSYHGKQGVREFFTTALETLEFLAFEPLEFVATPTHVLVQGREQVRVKANGRTWSTEWAHVFALQHGRIVKMREYYDTAVMVAAFRDD